MNYFNELLSKIEYLKKINPDGRVVNNHYLAMDEEGNCYYSKNPEILDNDKLCFAIADIYFNIRSTMVTSKGNVEGVGQYYAYIFDGEKCYENETDTPVKFRAGQGSIGIKMDSIFYSWCSDCGIHKKLPYLHRIMYSRSDIEKKYLYEMMQKDEEIERLKDKNIALEAAKDFYKEFVDYIYKMIKEDVDKKN